MQTRCPACQTLYRIDEDVLKRAGGQARCFRCDQVFNAHDNMVDDAAPGQGNALSSVDEQGIANSDISEDTDSSSILSELNDLPNVPDHSGLESHSELNLDELAASLRELDSEPSEDDALFTAPPSFQPEPPDPQSSKPDPDSLDLDPLDVPSELSPDALQDAPLPDANSSTSPTGIHPPGVSNLSLVIATCLTLLVVVQVAWFNRDQVLATPQGQAIAEGVCSVIGCTLTPRRAASRFAVLHRDIGTDPTQAGVLQMQLRFRNQADFAQPLPDIQLSLYDSEEKLMARRRLHPDEYLFPAPPSDTLVGPNEDIAITLLLEDPGRHTTGFKLEFL